MFVLLQNLSDDKCLIIRGCLLDDLCLTPRKFLLRVRARFHTAKTHTWSLTKQFIGHVTKNANLLLIDELVANVAGLCLRYESDGSFYVAKEVCVRVVFRSELEN